MKTDEILKTDDIAKLLDLNRQTVTRLFKRGDLKGKKLGKIWVTTWGDFMASISDSQLSEKVEKK